MYLLNKVFDCRTPGLMLVLVLLTLRAHLYEGASCQHLKRVTRGVSNSDSSSEEQPLTHDDLPLTEAQELAARLEEETEYQLRLEFIKQQILKRLGLTRAPKLLRKPVEVEAYMHLVEVQQHLRDLQSGGSATQSRFSSRLGGDSNLGSSYQSELTDGSDKLFVFPVLTTSTSATFNLTLNPATASTKVKKITLLLKQQIGVATDTDDYDITLAASSWTRGQVEDINEPLIIGTISPESLPESHENYYEPIVQWVEYDLSPLLLEKPLGQRNLVVINSQWRKISLAYLRVEYDDIQINRRKRSVDCDAGGNSSSCCRESFYVNFTTIGWDNWIIQPAGYFANFCKGTCDISHARYHHTTVVQKYPSIISLCCSPNKMSHISLIYIDEAGFVLQKNLPNMVVDSCDCA